MKRITAVVMTLLMLLSVMTFTVSAANAPGEDPTPDNIGNPTVKEGISISRVRQFVDGNGTPWLAGAGVGAHGGHETRIVRTSNGTYATYITNATGAPDDEHPNWYNGVATFDIIKITASGFESIYTGVYPQAAGSCTPNIMFDGDHTVYVTIIADDKDRYAETMGTPGFTNGIWLEVIEVDITTDTVTAPSSPSFFDHTTSPFSDHGYGYSQPCLDVAHGKLYAITNGGEAEDPDNAYPQGGYIAWWIYDLNTRTWDPTCHTIERFSRRCYPNVYPDGNGGFTMIIERCAPSAELGKALGCTFSTSGYLWDALYVMHVPDPNVDYAEDTVIWEPTYVAGARNNIANASHYGTGGCTYLDDQGRIHVIYSTLEYTPSTSKTKVLGAYHAMYDLSGNEICNDLIPTSLLANNGTKRYSGPGGGFAMTQGPDGVYYVFVLNNSSTSTSLEIWSSPANDGVNFTKTVSSTALKDPDGNNIAKGVKPIIANSRNGSVLDGTVALMFHTSGSSGDPYYYFSVKVPGEAHTHSYTAVVTEPTFTEQGYTTHTCSCGDSYIDSYTDPLATLSASLILSDSIDVRIYVNNVTPEVVSSGYYVDYSTDGGETFTPYSFDGHLVPGENAKYGFTVDSISANQMTKEIVFRVCDADGNPVKSIEYSVKDYCDHQIANPTSEGMDELCNALMAYGYYAQQVFPDTASDAIGPEEYDLSDVENFDADLSGYTGSVNVADPVTGATASLALESKTALNFYLYGVTSADGATVTVGGEAHEFAPVEDEAYVELNKCRITVPLVTTDMLKEVELTCSGTTVTYSPMAYVKYAVNNNTGYSDVCKALYIFCTKACGLFE